MHTIFLDGAEYPLRCDLNVIEQIEEEYGSLSSLADAKQIAAVKFLAVAMINEAFYHDGKPDRVTADFVGSKIMPGELKAAYTAVSGCLGDALKNA